MTGTSAPRTRIMGTLPTFRCRSEAPLSTAIFRRSLTCICRWSNFNVFAHLAAAVQNECRYVTMRQITNLTQPSTPPEPLDPRKLEFGKMFTPNFFVTEYRNGDWTNPRIQSLGPFALHPASTVFHYSQTVFEGLKAFRQDDGQIVLFRPDMNAKRLRRSSVRLAIPEIDETFFLEAVSA